MVDMLRQESMRQRWRRITHASKLPRANQVFSVKVPVSGTDKVDEFKTEEGVFAQVSTNLSQRFRLALTAPCYQGQLFDNIGFVGSLISTTVRCEVGIRFQRMTNTALLVSLSAPLDEQATMVQIT